MTEGQKPLRKAVAMALRERALTDTTSLLNRPASWEELADAAIAVALERAAQVAETYGRVVRRYSDGSTLVDTQGGKEIAAAIRALIPASGDATS